MILKAIRTGVGFGSGTETNHHLHSTNGAMDDESVALFIEIANLPIHTTPASSKCRQLCTPTPRFVQLVSRSSVPMQSTSSRKIGPLPWPNLACNLASAPTVTTINSLIHFFSSSKIPSKKYSHKIIFGQTKLSKNNFTSRVWWACGVW